MYVLTYVSIHVTTITPRSKGPLCTHSDWLGATKFSTIIHPGRRQFLEVDHIRSLKGAGLQEPQLWRIYHLNSRHFGHQLDWLMSASVSLPIFCYLNLFAGVTLARQLFLPYIFCLSIYLVLIYFYRATLCVSTVFVVARCPSVRPSVTFVHSIQTAEGIFKFLCRPGSPIILVFWPPAPIPNSNGNPFSGGAKQWVGKFCDFPLKSPSITETVRDRPVVAITLIGSYMCSIEWWHFQWPWWTSNPVFKVTTFLKSNISRTKLL